MDITKMNTNDAPFAKFAKIFATIDGNRYTMAMAKDVEAKANVSTKEVPMLGSIVTGHKPSGVKIQIKMTIYKCTEIFDNVIETYIKTGIMPTIDIQITNEDPASSIGRSSKTYNNCVIDGDVLLSMAKSGDDFIEQEINAYASDYNSSEKFTNPSYM